MYKLYHENIEQTEEQGSVSGRDDRLVYVIPKEIVSGDIGVTVYFGKGMVSKMNAKESILNGKAALGIEFGSTRIKAVLIDENCETLAVGSYHWENQLVDGIWTYSLEMIHTGLQACYKDLADKVRAQHDVPLTKLAGIGISAMMHGYMAFNKEDELLVPFRTWRNTMTEEAAAKLTEEFQINVPERYSISHLYQAILKNEEHVKDITFFTTLAGYIHWQLTGQKVLGVGDASGMFPIDCATKDYDEEKLAKFDKLIEGYHFPWTLREILPKSLTAGEEAGVLTVAGAKLLDPTGTLEAGIPLCPPEGDAGTGMVATNSVKIRTGNVSAGTSVFAMIVMEKELQKLHTEIDLVTTPAGDLVAMVHCNNCTSDINAWVNLFGEFAAKMGMPVVDKGKLYDLLFKVALEGEPDCGGLLSYNYFSGESITGFDEGRPLFVRHADDKLSLANFMRAHLFTALGALKNGLDILLKEENVPVDKIYGHGGFFTVPGAGQKIMAAAMNTPVSVMDTASEGGAWGIAVLAQYMVDGADEALADYLDHQVFAGQTGTTLEPDPADVKGFDDFLIRYNKGLAIERAAVESI